MLFFIGLQFLCVNSLVGQTDDNPLEPAGQFGGEITAGTIQDGYYYMGQGMGLATLYYSNGQFQQRSYIDLPGMIASLIADRGRLYAILRDNAGFFILDASDPFNPSVLGSCAIETNNDAGLACSGQYVYVAAGIGGFNVVDVSNPLAPVVVQKVPSSYPDKIVVEGNLLAALTTSTSPDELELFDLTDPAVPALLSSLDVRKTSNLTLHDNYVYLSCSEYTGGENGLRIVNATDPANPFEISYLKTEKRGYSVFIHDDRAFLTCQGGVYVMDISNKQGPVLIGTYENPVTWAEVRGIHYEEPFLTVRNTWADTPLQQIDLSNPAAPVEAASYFSPSDVGSLLVRQDVLYASSTQFLFSYDIGNDPENPVFQSTTAYEEGLMFLKTNGALLAGITWSSLRFYDLLDPFKPQFVGEYALDGQIFNYAFNETRAYVLADPGELHILDITNPATPVVLHQCPVSGTPHDLFLNNNLLFLVYDNGNNTGGVEIFR
ncbi:MAG TPA: hypothetical protein PLK12_16320, partial [Prolixibacteraceae bacterium]|nr:hypothetical protein [Prolixibacteraceae bacterium]